MKKAKACHKVLIRHPYTNGHDPQTIDGHATHRFHLEKLRLATYRQAKVIKMDCMHGFIVENWNPKNYLNSEKFHIWICRHTLRLLNHTDAHMQGNVHYV